ncbi:hypothetical protein BDY19DRAFT_692539 [Irpex rosettiformis]|uniref:Uncharacterized protein n=1 Tax=Irpex rosettiformis TaxID=378272 RepID=A0ACB8UAM8_9APHY|nr:hypothetical protein BDY19DRAFT_692539 [Irpex rosettiformis]
MNCCMWHVPTSSTLEAVGSFPTTNRYMCIPVLPRGSFLLCLLISLTSAVMILVHAVSYQARRVHGLLVHRLALISGLSILYVAMSK